jgi:hypothetical protein
MVTPSLNFNVCPKNLRLLYTHIDFFFVSKDIVLFGFNTINKKYSSPEIANSNQIIEGP